MTSIRGVAKLLQSGVVSGLLGGVGAVVVRVCGLGHIGWLNTSWNGARNLRSGDQSVMA